MFFPLLPQELTMMLVTRLTGVAVPLFVVLGYGECVAVVLELKACKALKSSGPVHAGRRWRDGLL